MEKTISENLKEAKFIVCKKNLKKPKTEFKGDDWNNKLINFEEANIKLNEGYNIGLVSGHNDFFVIDCDSLELTQACEGLLPKTYTEETCSGGTHYIYRIKEKFENLNVDNEGKHLGEIRCDREYVVIAPSYAKNKQEKMGNYTILKDESIPYVTKTQVEEVIKQFMKGSPEVRTGTISQDLLNRISKDKELKELYETELEKGSRSEAEQKLVNKLVSRNFNKEEIFTIMGSSKIGKWNEKPLSYRNLTYDKATQFVTTEKKDWKEIKGLNVLGMEDYALIKDNKNFIIQDMVYPSEIRMLYAPSGFFKSLEMVYEALCIASGKKFLDNFKVKKQPVLIISAENSKVTDKRRLFSIAKGLGIRKRKNVPLYILPRNECEEILSESFKLKLQKTINEKGIKVIYLDTINPLTPELDDNKGRDVTLLFNEFLKPIADGGVHITFLHHTDKVGKQFLGSVKWKANSDCLHRIERKDLKEEFMIYNEKNRDGENKTLKIGIKCEKNKKDIIVKTKFNLLEETDPSIFKKQKKMTQLEFFIMKLNQIIGNRKLERKEIYETFKQNKVIFSIDKSGKNSTLERAIKEWKENK